MARRLMIVCAFALAALGGGLYAVTAMGAASAVTPKFDNARDTVHCSSFSVKVALSPALVLGGSSPTTIKVSGTLNGCTDATGRVSGSATPNVNTVFSGSVSGLLAGSTNNLADLFGCSTATGTLTFRWKGFYNNGSTVENLLYKTTVVSMKQILVTTFNPGSPFGTGNVTTDGFGEIAIGAAANEAGCTPASYSTPGAFLGSDGGVSTSGIVLTSLDISGIIAGQANSATKTTYPPGIGAFYGG